MAPQAPARSSRAREPGLSATVRSRSRGRSAPGRQRDLQLDARVAFQRGGEGEAHGAGPDDGDVEDFRLGVAHAPSLGPVAPRTRRAGRGRLSCAAPEGCHECRLAPAPVRRQHEAGETRSGGKHGRFRARASHRGSTADRHRRAVPERQDPLLESLLARGGARRPPGRGARGRQHRRFQPPKRARTR